MNNLENYDDLKFGDYVTANWLEQESRGTGLIIEKPSIGKEYFLKYRSDLTAQSPLVKNIGQEDNSAVFEIKETLESQLNVTNNSLDVSIQDQNTDLVDYYFCRQIRDLQIASTLTLGSYVVSVVNATGVVANNYVCIQENKRAFQAMILSINGNNLTLDTPIDYPFTSNASIAERNPNMNVNGSGTPFSFVIAPKNGVKWDITRIIFQMVMSTAGSDALFGNLPALTKGVVLRKTDGIHHTIFNAKTNGDFALRMYDITYTDRATPTQAYGLRGRRSFNGFDKNGVVIRLDGDNEEKLELLVQDNLSSLTSFRIVAQGHVVE